MILIDSKLRQLKFTLFILTEQGHFLRLALEFAIVLLDQSILVILQLDLALLIQSVFLLPYQLLLLFLVLTKDTLSFSIQLLSVLLHLVTEHTTAVLVLNFDLMLQLSQCCFILAFFLSLELEDLTIRLLLHLSLLLLKLTLKVPLQIFQLNVELALHLAFLCLQALYVSTLEIKLLILFIFEFFKFKLISFPLALFDCSADTFVTAGKSQLLSLKLLIQFTFEIGKTLFSIGTYHLHLFLFFYSKFVLKRTKLLVSFRFGLRSNFLLLLSFELLPLLSLPFNVLLILNHELFLSQFKMLVNLFDALSKLCLYDHLVLVDFLSSFGLNKWVILFGAKDWTRSKVLASRCVLDLRIVSVCTGWRSTTWCLSS